MFWQSFFEELVCLFCIVQFGSLDFFLNFLSRYARCTRSVSIGQTIISPSFFFSVFFLIFIFTCNLIISIRMVIFNMWNHAVPPAYYAHLAAFRARYYIEGETSDSGSTGATGRSVEARSLPVVKENVKDVMFYCWYSWPFFCVAIWDFFAESNQPTCVHQSARIAVVDAERSERRRHIQHFSPFVANGDIQDVSFSVNNAFEPVGLKRTSLFNVMLFNLRLLKFSEIF